jgi:hypothetical protein
MRWLMAALVFAFPGRSVLPTIVARRDPQSVLSGWIDSDAVEGSLAIDTIKAAEMIRVFATNSSNPFVKDKNLATITRALKVVLRRYGIGREQRADMVGGEHVPPHRRGNNQNNNDEV